MQYSLFYSWSRLVVIRASSGAVMIMWAFSAEKILFWTEIQPQAYENVALKGINTRSSWWRHGHGLCVALRWEGRWSWACWTGVELLWELGYHSVSWQEEWSISSISVFGTGDECIHGETMFKCFISLFQPVKLSAWLMATRREAGEGRRRINGRKQRCWGVWRKENRERLAGHWGIMVPWTQTSKLRALSCSDFQGHVCRQWMSQHTAPDNFILLQ